MWYIVQKCWNVWTAIPVSTSHTLCKCCNCGNFLQWRNWRRRSDFKAFHVSYDKKSRVLYIYIYTGCPRRNVPDFGRVFLTSDYNDITQNTYIQSSMITEILAREKCVLLWCLRTILCPWRDPLDLHRDNPAVACSWQRRPWLRNRCS